MPLSSPEEPPATVAKPAPSAPRFLSEITKTLLLAALVFVGARTIVLPYEVEGASMTPNLHNRERVLVNRTVYFHFDVNRVLNWVPGVQVEGSRTLYPFHSPERGDVVVLDPPVRSNEPFIKRVIGLPGETVTFRDGRVYVDGALLDEPYISGAITSCTNTPYCEFGPIPAGSVYVLGDNRRNSTDSRSFGPVKIASIVGKAWFSNWPLDDIGIMPHYDYAE